MKDKILNNKLIILIPTYWACLFDALVTIFNQPKSYWNGDLKTPDEENLFVRFFLSSWGLLIETLRLLQMSGNIRLNVLHLPIAFTKKVTCKEHWRKSITISN